MCVLWYVSEEDTHTLSNPGMSVPVFAEVVFVAVISGKNDPARCFPPPASRVCGQSDLKVRRYSNRLNRKKKKEKRRTQRGKLTT